MPHTERFQCKYILPNRLSELKVVLLCLIWFPTQHWSICTAPGGHLSHIWKLSSPNSSKLSLLFKSSFLKYSNERKPSEKIDRLVQLSERLSILRSVRTIMQYKRNLAFFHANLPSVLIFIQLFSLFMFFVFSWLFSGLVVIANDCGMKRNAFMDFDSVQMTGPHQVALKKDIELDDSRAAKDGNWTTSDESSTSCPLLLFSQWNEHYTLTKRVTVVIYVLSRVASGFQLDFFLAIKTLK